MTEHPTEMQAAFIQSTGPAESIIVGPLPVPAIGPTDVLVKVEASPVNHVDALIRSGQYRQHTPKPFVVGRDAVGEVVASGPGVRGFNVGEKVWTNTMGHGGRQGTASEYVCVAADRLYTLPSGVDVVDAAAVVHPAATAAVGLFHRVGLRSTDTVYVGGGAGNVGRAVVALASAAGARVIASARDRDLEKCLEAGAATAIDYRDPKLLHKIAEAAPRGVDVHWDTSGQHEFDQALSLMARGGRIVAMTGALIRAPLPVGVLYQKDVSVVGFVVSNANVHEMADVAGRINRAMAAGLLTTKIADLMPLSKAAEAHRLMEFGLIRGARLVLKPSP